MKAYLATLLTALGVFSGELGREARADDKYTAILAKELDYVKTQTYDIVYPEMKARRFVPVDNSADTGAETISYTQWDGFGIAQIISNYADDIPMVEVLAEEFTVKVKGIALGYWYSIQDMRRAAMARVPLSQAKARWCRRNFEQKIENIIANGDVNSGLKGLMNNENVAVIAPLTGSWGSATGAQICDDLLYLVAQFVSLNKETFAPTHILLDITSYNRAASKRMSTTGDANYTALKAFKESCPYDVTVEAWNKLALSNATGDGPRAICYTRDPDVVRAEIPQEFEQMPPERKGFTLSVATHGRIAGVVWSYPLGGAYMDGLG